MEGIMRVINLIEDTEGVPGCAFEHGLSFYMETAKHKILLDFGASAKTLENAKKLGIALNKIDLAILSHGHYDHSGGILPFTKINPDAVVYMQETAGNAYYHVNGDMEKYIGIDPLINSLPQVKKINGNFIIDEEIELFAGITGRKFFASGNMELKQKTGGNYIEDSFAHEQCAVIRQGKETILFSGCAHNGILNIMDRYFELYHSYPLFVISGFHMVQKNGYSEADKENIRQVAKELLKTGTIFYTGHCTGQEAVKEMKQIMGEQLRVIHTGMAIECNYGKI